MGARRRRLHRPGAVGTAVTAVLPLPLAHPATAQQLEPRAGLTLAVPVTPRQSLKLTWADGVPARVSTNFQAIGLTRQYLWFDPARHKTGTRRR